ncbi:hypothetical protein [Caryophanon latum]|uniref:Lipoprotein n=1 Tax=Caryophanon latum TaxID=33977 RepID=A0A1C0YL32_9BACL|nr:hypothetical protein [Caryophanon latum]OCS87882.1 hypothetical protein A6K76_13830 [Caryophanon latum]
MKKSVLSIALAACLLAGCSDSGSNAEEAAVAFLEDVQDGNLIQAVTAVKGGNIQTLLAASQLDLPITDEQRDILLDSIERVFTFENVTLLEDDGTIATVEADVTTIHFLKAASSSLSSTPGLLLDVALGNTTTDDAIAQVVDETIAQLAVEEPPTTTFNVTLTLENDGGSYEIVPNDELVKALFGNIALTELFK